MAQRSRPNTLGKSSARTIEALLHLKPSANHLQQASRSLVAHLWTNQTFQAKEDELS